MRRALAIAVTGAVLLAACGEDGPGADQLVRAGLANHRAGDVEAAAEDYLAALAIEPDNEFALYNMGVIAQSRDEPRSAEEWYRLAIDAAPDFEPPHFNLALLLSRQGRTQEAIELYRAAVRVVADHAEAHFNLGLLLVQAGLDREGEREINTALELDPSLAGALDGAGGEASPQG